MREKRKKERERGNVLRFARIYFVFCCCLRKQTAGPWPNVGPSKQGLPRSLPYALYPGTRRSTLSSSSSKPNNRSLPFPPPPSPTLSELLSVIYWQSQAVLRLNQYRQRRRARHYCAPMLDDDDNDDDDDHGRGGTIPPLSPFSSLARYCSTHTDTRIHRTGIYQARVSSVKTFLLIGAQYLL